jgi:DNA-binding CsgD family transcriptional regulator
VAEFLEYDNGSDDRYKEKIKKQKRNAGIRATIYLDREVLGSIVANHVEDTVNFSNRDPLAIILEAEYLWELQDEYWYTMSRKQYDVFRYHEWGYNNTEIAEMLGVDESTVREQLYKAFVAAVFRYLKHSNADLMQSIKKEVREIYKNETQYTINRYTATLFLNRLFFFRPDQRHLLDFVNGTDYQEMMKKYFLERFFKTPENPL